MLWKSLRQTVAVVISVFTIISCSTTPSNQTLNEPPNYMKLGFQYANDGLFREAEGAYKKALAQNKQNPTAHRNIGIIYVKIGDYAKAINHLERSIEHYHKDYDAQFFLAEAYRMKEKYDEAIFRYKRSLKLNPKATKSLKALAWSYFQIRYYSEALRTALKLHKSASNDMQSSIILARIYNKVEEPSKALAIVRKAALHATKTELPYLLSVEGDIYLNMKKYNEASNVFRAALKDQPLLPGALLGLGICLQETGQKPELAAQYIERAIRIKPRMIEGFYYLGKVYQHEDKEKSAKYFRVFIKRAASDPDFASLINDSKDRLGQLGLGKK